MPKPARTLTVLLVVFGLLAFAVPAMADTSLTATLSGANEVPANDSPAAGFAKVSLNQAGVVCVSIRSGGYLGDVVAGHIHPGVAGVNGPPIIDLQVTSANHQICVSGVDVELVDAIRQNPSAYYINIHTTVIPSGEIRGQLG